MQVIGKDSNGGSFIFPVIDWHVQHGQKVVTNDAISFEGAGMSSLNAMLDRLFCPL